MSGPDTVPGTAVSLGTHPSAPGQEGTTVNRSITSRDEEGGGRGGAMRGRGDLTFLKGMKMP